MRKNEVTFSITPAPNTEATEERAKRLALFVSTIGERPESFLQLIKEHKTVGRILAIATHPEVRQYGAEVDDRDSYTFDVRALFATAQILRHEDDLEADADPETSLALRQGLEHRRAQEKQAELGRAEMPEQDWRVERLGIVATQLGDIRPDFDGNDPAVDVSLPVIQHSVPRVA